MRPRPSQIHRVVHDRSTIRWWCRPTLNEGGSHALQVCQHHHHQVVRVGNFVGLSETQGTRKGTRCSRLLRPIRLKPSRSHSAQRVCAVRDREGHLGPEGGSQALSQRPMDTSKQLFNLIGHENSQSDMRSRTLIRGWSREPTRIYIYTQNLCKTLPRLLILRIERGFFVRLQGK